MHNSPENSNKFTYIKVAFLIYIKKRHNNKCHGCHLRFPYCRSLRPISLQSSSSFLPRTPSPSPESRSFRPDRIMTYDAPNANTNIAIIIRPRNISNAFFIVCGLIVSGMSSIFLYAFPMMSTYFWNFDGLTHWRISLTSLAS
jgi:hypothetical protein